MRLVIDLNDSEVLHVMKALTRTPGVVPHDPVKELERLHIKTRIAEAVSRADALEDAGRQATRGEDS